MADVAVTDELGNWHYFEDAITSNELTEVRMETLKECLNIAERKGAISVANEIKQLMVSNND